jgi:hypothetical protein
MVRPVGTVSRQKNETPKNHHIGNRSTRGGLNRTAAEHRCVLDFFVLFYQENLEAKRRSLSAIEKIYKPTKKAPGHRGHERKSIRVCN